jgi:hypothetical protein
MVLSVILGLSKTTMEQDTCVFTLDTESEKIGQKGETIWLSILEIRKRHRYVYFLTFLKDLRHYSLFKFPADNSEKSRNETKLSASSSPEYKDYSIIPTSCRGDFTPCVERDITVGLIELRRVASISLPHKTQSCCKRTI